MSRLPGGRPAPPVAEGPRHSRAPRHDHEIESWRDMPPKKKIAALVKVQLQAGAATPAPPVGTALGPHGVNIMDFCKAYNAQTESMRGNVIPVERSEERRVGKECRSRWSAYH